MHMEDHEHAGRQHGHGHDHGYGRMWAAGGFGPGGRRAFGPFGSPFGEGAPFGGRGRGRGPGGPGGFGGPRGRARRGDVRASILALLKDRPMHGYEMIQEIAERSQGAWKPSPGSVYPTLQLLEDEGLITSETKGGKNLFALTESGTAEAEGGPEAPWEEAGRGVDWEAMSEARKAGGALFGAFQQVWTTGSAEQRDKALAVVNDARRKLYLILAEEE
jgi:DNA-binding PadR family transcriptional regulator